MGINKKDGQLLIEDENDAGQILTIKKIDNLCVI